MTYIITEFSKYIFIIAMAMYFVESIIPLFKVRGDMDGGVYIRQMVYIMLIHSLSMVSLYLTFDDPMYLMLYVFQLLCIFAVNRLTILIYDGCSKMLLNHMCLLLSIGFVELARINPEKALRQIIIIAVSLVLFLIIPIIIKKCKFLKDYGVLYATVGLLLLILVFTLGKTSNGSKLSYNIMGLTFQPSEFVKIIFVFFVAAMLYESQKFTRILVTSVIAAMYVGILVLSRDLGSALIFFVVYISMLFVATGKPWYSLIGLGCGAVGSVIAYKLFTHVQVRVAIWRDPWSDIDRTGYQLTQSLFAIGTGGWMGMGLGKGVPSSIPHVDEDFMFSAICEEYGVIFGIILVLMFLAIFVLLLKNTLRTKNMFYRLVQVGLSTILAIQTFLTIGGGTRLVPLTGVTLPLVSNGGSSAMSTIILFGICIGISILPKNFDMDDEEDYEEYEDDEQEEYLSKNEEALQKKRISAYILTGIHMVLFIALVVNLGSYMFKEKDQAISEQHNIKRQEIIAAGTVRGSILASDGTVLAETTIDSKGNETRVYPFNDLYCHTVGYSTYGKMGVENYMNMYLINSSISFAERTNNGINGRKNPGDSVYTTLVPELQQVAKECLGIYKGAVIATKADTGEILAMVSNPGFDPNTIDQEFDSIAADTKSTVLLNRASQGIYPPGSTFKVITTLEYLRENPDTYNNYRFTCNSQYRAGDTVIHCFKNTTHGSQNLYQSLANSCNSSYANIGMSLNKTDFANTLMELYFNKDIPFELETSQSHISMREYMDDHEMMMSSIGQGDIRMTPLHLNLITQAIANDGVMMKPYIVSKVQSADGNVIKTFSSSECATVMSKEESDELKAMLKYDVDFGTAKKLQGQEYTAAGKTGSAEYTDETGESHAWFTGFAPAENPQIVVTVILEGAGTGGDYSVPITRRMFSKYFELYGLPESVN